MPASLLATVVAALVGGALGSLVGLAVVGTAEPDDPRCPACGGALNFSWNLPFLAWFVQFPSCFQCSWRAAVWSWPHEWVREHLATLRRPRACPGCAADLSGGRVSLAGWVTLLARCSACGVRLGRWYGLLILGLAIMWGAAVWHLGFAVPTVIDLLFVTLLVAITVTDAALQIIPHEYTFGGFVLGIVRAVLGGGDLLVAGLVGALVGAGLIWLVGAVGSWWLKQEAMGTGDINMMAMVGVFLGWKGVLLTIMLGSVLGVLVVGPIALLKREKYLKLPFGVFLAGGALVAFLFGSQVIDWYVRVLLGA